MFPEHFNPSLSRQLVNCQGLDSFLQESNLPSRMSDLTLNNNQRVKFSSLLTPESTEPCPLMVGYQVQELSSCNQKFGHGRLPQDQSFISPCILCELDNVPNSREYGMDCNNMLLMEQYFPVINGNDTLRVQQCPEIPPNISGGGGPIADPSNSGYINKAPPSLPSKTFNSMTPEELMIEVKRLELEVESYESNLIYHHQIPPLLSPNDFYPTNNQCCVMNGSTSSFMSTWNSFEKVSSYTCKWYNCGASFSEMRQLSDHIENAHICHGKSSYICEWNNCERNMKPFAKRHKIVNHIRKHTGEKPYACSATDCGRRFSRADSLAAHTKTHKRNRRYSCPILGCGKTFHHIRTLKRHENCHDGSKHRSTLSPFGGSSF